MGREWPRNTIEELIRATARMMIKNGEIDLGGEPVDYRNPYNAPFMIDVCNFTGTSGSYQVEAIGIIRSGCFNPNNTGINPYDTYLSDPLGPGVHLSQYPSEPPVVMNSYDNPSTIATIDYDVKSSYALSSRASFCCRLRLNKVLPTGLGSVYSNFLIIQNQGADNDYLPYVEKNGYLLFPDSSNYNTGRKSIASVFLDKHGYGDYLGNDGAVKAKTFIYVNNSSGLFGQTNVSVIDNPPPLFFLANGVTSDTVSKTYNSLAFEFSRNQVCICVAFLVADTTEMQSVIDWFQNANHNACVYAYCFEMTDEQVKKWVNPNNPSSVTVNHITI